MSLYYGDNTDVEAIVSVDIAGAWEFNILLVLKDKTTGKLHYGFDSGCSYITHREAVEKIILSVRRRLARSK